MSDLKNVLKAGFLLTASLLATGCGDSADSADTPAPAPAPNPNVGVSDDTAAVPTFTLKLGAITKDFNAAGVPVATLLDRSDAVNGYGEKYDLIANMQIPPKKVTLAANTPAGAENTAAAVLSLVNFTPIAKETFLFKADSKVNADKNHATALILDGAIDTKRHQINGFVDGDLRIPAVVLRNAVLEATDAKAASVTATYAYVGIDSAFGYPNARQNDDGKPIDLGIEVNAVPAEPVAAVKLAATTSTSTAKKVTAGTSSKATMTKKVDPVANKAKAAKTVVPVQTASANGVLTLKFVKPTSDSKTVLDIAGLNVKTNQGTFDIGGRVAKAEVNDVVISSISFATPELEHLSDLKAKAVETTKVTKKPAAVKLAATAKSAPKKSTATTTKVQSKSTATATKPTTSQAIVKQADNSHHFLFKVVSGGLYSEIGDLAIGENVTFNAISHHSLFVHNLQMKNDLNIRVLVEDHTLSPLTATSLTSFDAAKGQEMMVTLEAEDHSVEYSDAVETDGKVTAYAHYDSHTPFPLWVSEAAVTAGKTLKLEGVDLSAAGILSEGVYTMPLVKDMSGKLPNSSGNDALAIALDEKAIDTLIIKEWKIISNGYFDKVLLVEIAKKTASGSGLSSGIIERTLMSSKAQGGRSVALTTLDSVVSKLDPTHLVSRSFASLSSARANQASQFASLVRGVNAANSQKLGAVESYAVTFNHAGAQVGLTYNLEGGNAFSSKTGTTSFGANVATDVLGMKAIVSAEASVDAGKNAYASSSLTSYNAGLTFAKAYSAGGLSVVPMGGFGVSSNALDSYTAAVPMAAGALGLSMNDVSFSAATFHAGVSVALDDIAAAATGVNASLTLGVAGYLASTANATLSTSEGKSTDLQFAGSAVTPYAQFNLGFASGEKLNTMISSGIAAVSFGLDR